MEATLPVTVGSEEKRKQQENRWLSFLLARGKHISFPYADVRKDTAQEPCGEIKHNHRLRAPSLECMSAERLHALGRTPSS